MIVKFPTTTKQQTTDTDTEGSLELENLLREDDEPHEEKLFLSRDVNFRLTEYLKNLQDDPDVHVTREIERLISDHKYQAAYDLHKSDSIHETPEDFKEFLEKYINL